MFEFVSHIFNDLHPILVHFPIALLLVSFGLTIAARFKPEFHETSWLLLVLGGLATLPATEEWQRCRANFTLFGCRCHRYCLAICVGRYG